MSEPSVKSNPRATCKMLWTLFSVFFQIGAFTFGGGYAMIPLIQRETAEKRSLVPPEQILDIVAIAESTPGPIAINAATFIGCRCAGAPGALAATFGVVLPSFCIIFVLSFFLRRLMQFAAVRYAFAGIRAGVLALVCRAFFNMYRQCPKGSVSYFVGAAALGLSAFTGLNVLWIVAASALLGLLFSLLPHQKKEG